jgi:peptide/nickel transport system substrate-binding protein
MFTKNRIGLLLAALLVVALGLVACQPQQQVVEVTRIVTETITEEGQEVVVTSVVTEVEEVVVTATPVPVEEAVFVAPDATTYVNQTFGDPSNLDPALGYDTATNTPIQNIYETLIWYNGPDPTTFIPVLATEVPSVENGGISEDGMTYTFNIREGVTFHDGAELTPSDVAYSFQRGLLQSDPNGPQWLLLEPILGYHADVTEGIQDGAFAGDPEALKAGATPEELLATCEMVKAAVVADDAAGTVTFNLVTPWGPLLATLAGTWGSVVDQEWTAAQGDWDGDCATWQDHYAPGTDNSKLTSVANGTGPYMLDHWTPGEEYVLTANPNYWRAEGDPMWEGGPSGVPAIQTVIVQNVTEFGTRLASLQAGDAADIALGSTADRPQVDPFVGEICDAETGTCTVNEENPNGPIRKWINLGVTTRTDMFPTWNIAPDSAYIGSGQLDGEGIPPDFFTDINVRKALATCFDYETYIQDVQLGEGVRNNGPIIQGMLGYNPDGPMYEYDPEACAGYLAEAWGGQLPTTGFRFQIAYNVGNTARQAIASILQQEIGAAAEEGLYNVEVVSLPWPTFLNAFQNGQLPVQISGWAEDIHDPHNWVVPYTYTTFGGRQGLPEELMAKYQELASAAVVESDPAAREEMYFAIQEEFYNDAISVILSQGTGVRYEQRWVQSWFDNEALPGDYYYSLSLAGQ